MAATSLRSPPTQRSESLTQPTLSDVNNLPSGFLPYVEFAQQFSLGGTSTEKTHQGTKTLSQTMQVDIAEGLKMLLDADQAVVEGFNRFIPVVESCAPELSKRMKAGGRIFLVGSGSSGRVALDIAAKCTINSPDGPQIRGIIAGGDSALIRAKEGFEDSESDGEKCLQAFNLRPEDTVFLISASGSASFNVGCGHFAANEGSQVYYFYNSKDIPLRTQKLFERQNNPVKPLELDIGPQAISGSTRLQGASLAEMCLGALLGTALFHYEEKADDASQYPSELAAKIKKANDLIKGNLEKIAQFVRKEADALLSPNANFRRLRDETSEGYVTVIGNKNTLREGLIDATEICPTFSTGPMQRESQTNQKREEFRAYLVGEQDNCAAWKALLGRECEPEDFDDVNQFLLALETEGIHSYNNRPTGKGNFVMGLAKTIDSSEGFDDILKLLQDVLEEDGNAGMIALSRAQIEASTTPGLLTLFLENVPFDHLGLVETLLLKQILNLISNGSMILAGKVHGNRMIDMRASNRKLIDRVLRLVKDIWADSQRPLTLSDESLYHYIAHVCTLKKSFEDQGVYTPSIVKVILAMIHLEKKPIQGDFQDVLNFLADKQERLDFLSV